MVRKTGWKIAKFGLMTVALILVATIASYAATVTGLTVTKTDERVEIHVNATGPVYYRVLSINKPRQALVVEMSPALVLEKATRTIQIDKGIIERARIIRYQADKARLVVEVLHPTKYYIKAAPEYRGIVLVMNTQTIAAKESKAVLKMAAGMPTMESPEPMQPPTTVAKAGPTEEGPYRHRDLRAAARARRVPVRRVKLVSIDFVNADLIYVLKLLARELGVNLVTDATVTGSVTMTLRNVSAQTAMNILIQLNGYKQKKLANILFIGSEETMNAITPDVIAYEPVGDVRIATIRLQNISATDAVSTIKSSYPLVQVHPSPQGNAVVVHANQKMLDDVRTLISGVDIPRPEVPTAPTEKVEVVMLKYSTAADILTTLTKLLGTDAPATIEVDRRLNALIFKGYESQIQKAKDQLEEIDIPMKQVMLSVKVVDLSETGAKNLGLNWSAGTQDGTQPIMWYEIPGGYPNDPSFTPVNPYSPYTSTPPTYGDVPVGFFVRDPLVLRSALSMQITKGEAKVLASPRVAAVSGRSATIHIGDRYPIVYYDPRAGQYQVIYVDIGIRLTVRPTISTDGYVTTDINTTVSDLRELINNQYPRTTERSAELTIRVKDNDTIVIGGLVEDRSRVNTTKIPLLGDIPILGMLFKQKTFDQTKGEVVIMITPKIITM